MSAEVAWSAVRKNTAYTVKRAGVVFSHQSVNGKHSVGASYFGRKAAADVVRKGKKYVLVTRNGTKTSVVALKRGKANETIRSSLATVRPDLVNKTIRKYRIAFKSTQ